MAEQLAEILDDSGSGSGFSGFDSNDEWGGNGENENGYVPGAENNDDGTIPSGYNHPWLQNFFRQGFIGPKHIPENNIQYKHCPSKYFKFH